MSNRNRIQRASGVLSWAIVAGLVSTCSARSTTPSHLTPMAGHYVFEYFDAPDRYSGTITIQMVGDSLSGQIAVTGRPVVSISTATTFGQQLVLTADLPTSILVLRMRFSGDDFEGDWSLMDSGGWLRGTRVP